MELNIGLDSDLGMLELESVVALVWRESSSGIRSILLLFSWFWIGFQWSLSMLRVLNTSLDLLRRTKITFLLEVVLFWDWASLRVQRDALSFCVTGSSSPDRDGCDRRARSFFSSSRVFTLKSGGNVSVTTGAEILEVGVAVTADVPEACTALWDDLLTCNKMERKR